MVSRKPAGGKPISSHTTCDLSDPWQSHHLWKYLQTQKCNVLVITNTRPQDQQALGEIALHQHQRRAYFLKVQSQFSKDILDSGPWAAIISTGLVQHKVVRQCQLGQRQKAPLMFVSNSSDLLTIFDGLICPRDHDHIPDAWELNTRMDSWPPQLKQKFAFGVGQL